jgi:hypothetical protein
LRDKVPGVPFPEEDPTALPLDRQTIEKRDFPIGRRGYEPEAVDVHLGQIAEEVDELRRQVAAAGQAQARPARTSPASIAQAASEQVRAIVEAAETSAADIERGAQDEADRIRGEAESDARRTRNDAIAKSESHVGDVRDATGTMLQRIDAMETELSALVEGLRTGANRLTADLALLEQGMGDLYEASGRRPTGGDAAGPAVVLQELAVEAVYPLEPEDDQLELPEEAPAPVAVADEPATAGEQHVAAAPPARPSAPAAAAPAEPASSPEGDAEGARLVALNMALNGTPREETDRYLADNFDVGDRAALLDEVYATVGG